MNLPGWVFMLIGTGVVAYSRYVETANDSNLIMFTVMGGLFILYGLGKEAVHRFKSKPKTVAKAQPPQEELSRKDHRHPAGHHYHGKSHHEQHPHAKPHPPHSHPHRPAHKRCANCHTTVVLDAKFCHRCGFQF